MKISISFLLKEPKAIRPTPIFAFVSFNSQRVKVATGCSIEPKQWNKLDQKALTRGYHQNTNLNERLDLIREQLSSTYADHLAKGIFPDADALRKATEPQPLVLTTDVKANPLPTFWSRFDEWINQTKSQGKLGTARSYSSTRMHLETFQSKRGYQVDFDTVTLSFGDHFTSYLLVEPKLGDNTINRIVKQVKRFMKWANDRGYTTNQGYQRITWKRYEPEIITLSESEVEHLAKHKLNELPHLKNARDLFLLACYTGLRYSDLITIREEHVHGTVLRITTQKTRDTVRVPLRIEAQLLVNRLLAGEIRPISNQKLNDYIKDAAKMAEINSLVEHISFQGGKRKVTTKAKWEYLTCHTARRTFATLALKRGLRPEIVRKVTGHKTMAAFQRYVNITQTDVEEEFNAIYTKTLPKKDS